MTKNKIFVLGDNQYLNVKSHVQGHNLTERCGDKYPHNIVFLVFWSLLDYSKPSGSLQWTRLPIYLYGIGPGCRGLYNRSDKHPNRKIFKRWGIIL